MQSREYSVRPSPSVRPPPPPKQRFESDDDYYFLKFGSPQPPRFNDDIEDAYFEDDDDWDDNYDEDENDDYDDDGDDGLQPGKVRPLFEVSDDGPKGPPSSFGNSVASASMSKTGYAPVSMKEDNDSPNGVSDGETYDNNDDGEDWGEEKGANTGSMMSPQ